MATCLARRLAIALCRALPAQELAPGKKRKVPAAQNQGKAAEDKPPAADVDK